MARMQFDHYRGEAVGQGEGAVERAAVRKERDPHGPGCTGPWRGPSDLDPGKAWRGRLDAGHLTRGHAAVRQTYRRGPMRSRPFRGCPRSHFATPDANGCVLRPFPLLVGQEGRGDQRVRGVAQSGADTRPHNLVRRTSATARERLHIGSVVRRSSSTRRVRCLLGRFLPKLGPCPSGAALFSRMAKLTGMPSPPVRRGRRLGCAGSECA
jgi:hypothetical protein